MQIAITLIFATALSFLLCKQIKSVPWLFYLLAIALCATGLYFYFLPAADRPLLVDSLNLYLRRGYLPFSLFTVVMFIGALSDTSPLRKALMPIRAELSITAAILIVGHFVPYLIAYSESVFLSAGLRVNVMVSLVISLVLILLLLPLVITSFNWIKLRMKTASWKRLQKLSYLFFILVYVHLMGLLLPSALQGSATTLISIIVYSVIFIAYIALRLRKAMKENALGNTNYANVPTKTKAEEILK